ncbi:MAG: ABC transporter ATP-binding protein [Desulfobacteraceae bacterium]|nr:ABC transporter ATP-binding protein [Desulfobacteraceae bacterium]MBC2751561.1 ABC transporter ATP-binding protein [Desulfobacteraceae bacterium]
MQHDGGYFEEGQLDKQRDLRLLRRLLPFLTPYRAMLTVSIVLVLLLTALDLTLPYLTKMAIDRYIVPVQTYSTPSNSSESAEAAPSRTTRWLALSDDNPALPTFRERYPELLVRRDTGWAIAYQDLGRLSLEDRRHLRQPHLTGLLLIAVAYLVLIMMDFLLNFIQKITMEKAGHFVMHDLRLTLFRRMQDFSMTFFARNPVGRLVTRVTNDVQNMHELFTSVLSMLFKDFFLLIGIGIVLVSMNWRLALAAFTVLPLVGLASWWFSRRVRDVFRRLRIKVAEINTRFAETIGGIRVIQSFRRETDNEKRFRRLNHENYQAGMEQIHILAIFMPLVEVLGVITVAIVILYGGGRILSGDMTLGILVAFISYMRMFFRPIRDLSEKYNILQNALASAERLFQVMDSPEMLPRPQKARIQAPVPDKSPLTHIVFDRVSFSYLPGEPVLQDISFQVPAGSTIALVGPTGSGKTTLTQLLGRFYLPDTGTIRINGRDIREWDPAILRRRMALVMQDPFLFSGSIRDNILPQRSTVSDETLRTLLADANCLDFVMRLPQGLETPLNEGGASLSSGERQLLSIARAFARQPDIIILDEATSYIDSETENRIQEALQRLTTGRTTFLVAHRLSTVKQADQILVLHHGNLIESGSHADLMARQAFYYRLQRLQG